MSTAAATPPARQATSSPGGGLRLAAFEVAWILLIFFLFAGAPPPDVGESHYLTKARHYWDPAWCAGDLFLESKDAHWTFYWTFGWVTKFCSLGASAWIGRALTWGLLAWSWRRLSWAIVPQPLHSLLSAGLLLFLLRNFHLAGEWIVGGVEAKGFAYVLVFLALEGIVRGRWRAALLLAGAAGAFHVLVGGWTVVAIGVAWLAAGRERPKLVSLIPAAIGGLALALPGLIPAVLLNRGVPEDASRLAARIYVFDRLAHHLVFHRFSVVCQARYAVLLAAWLPLAWSVRKEAGPWRLQLVAAGAVAIGLAGVVIDQALVLMAPLRGWSIEEFQLQAAPLLRYYWFRMSDSLVPVGVSLAAVWWLARLQRERPAWGSWLMIGAIVGASANVADMAYWRSRRPVPGAIVQPRPTADSGPQWWLADQPTVGPNPGAATVDQWMDDWKAICRWAKANTPPDARFLTPRHQQTFKWYAERSEVANWKDVPQDAASLVEWRSRLSALYPRDRLHHAQDLAAHSDEDLLKLAQTYQAGYIIIDRTRSRRPIALPRVYPLLREENPSFDVYRVPKASER
jgi:hypothetical protein